MLPIDELESAFRGHSGHLVVTAPTGSGKSTRVPQWCEPPVLVVEPRRLACRRLAHWIAESRGEVAGQSVGFSVRFEQKMSAQTQIFFVTPGVALNYAAEGRLQDFSTVVIDEFHERGLETDLFLPLVQERHPQARLVVMSATLEGQRLADHLGARLLEGHGSLHPVEVQYCKSPEVPTGKDLAARVARECRRAWNDEQGVVLAFLPGMRDISEVASRLSGLPVVKLHGSFSHQEQDRAFQDEQPKIVLSTNVAESSVTVPGVTAVVDSGLVKQFIHRAGHSALTTVPISWASADQRKGRAGRLRPGRCYRCWHQAAELPSTTPPELQRLALDEVVLRAAAAGARFKQLRFLDPPPEFALEEALERLRSWGALDHQERLTDFGQRLSRIPLPAEKARLLLAAPETLSGDVADLLAVLESRSSLFLFSSKDEVLEARKEELPGSAPISSILALRRGQARRHHLSQESLQQTRKVAQQLRELRGLGKAGEERPQERELVHFLASHWPERAFVKRKKREAWGNGSQEVRLSRSEQVPDGIQAALMLEIEPVAGRGLGVDLRARYPLPCSFSQLRKAGLGEPVLGSFRVTEEGGLTADLEYRFADRTLGKEESEPVGGPLRQAVVQLIQRGKLFRGYLREVEEALFYHDLEQAFEEGEERHTEVAEYLLQRLEELGVHRWEDRLLLEPDDLLPPDPEPWNREQLKERFPMEFHSGEALYRLQYRPSPGRVTLNWVTGTKNAKLNPRFLPRWENWPVWLDERGRKTKIR